jgi:IclR family pca regulon transcriptional regulator
MKPPSNFIAQFDSDPNFVTSLARGLAAMHAFSQKRRHLSIAQVAHRTGVSRAAARRSLHTLQCLGYVSADESNRYFLRPKVLAFGDAYLSAMPIAVLAQSVLDKLSDDVRESCSLGILDGDEIVYLARSVSSRIFSTTLNVGRRLPAYCSSIGNLLLGELPPHELDAYLTRVRLHSHTNWTEVSRDMVRERAMSAATAGFAISDQQWEPRICTIAVPVRDTSGAAVAGINLLFQSGRMTPSAMVDRFLRPLQEAAHALGMMLLP